MSTPLNQFQLEDTARLREYFGIIRVRKWSVLAITLIATVASLYYAKQQADVYTSTTQIQTTNPIAAFLPVTAATAPNIGTEEELAVSTAVGRCAHFIYLRPAKDPGELCTPERLAGAQPPLWFLEGVTTDVPTLTSVLEISFTDESPTIAQRAAQAYAAAYVQYKQQQAIDYVDNLRAPLLELQDSLTAQAAQLTRAVNDDIATSNTAAFQSDQAQLSFVNGQLSATQLQLVGADPAKITPPTVIFDAPLPDSPSNQVFKLLLIFVGFVVGLTLGVGQAFVRHRLDDRIRGRTDLESRLGAPVLAIVPHLRIWHRRSTTHLITLERRWSPAAEAYRALRTSIMFSAAVEGSKVIMVTSSGEGEGKTTTAANLSVVLAEAGKRVIIVSADLRKPRLAKFFHMATEQERGVTNVVSGEIALDDALQTTTVENLLLLGSGPIPGRPTDMLFSTNFAELIASLKAKADFVILDTTPLLVVADALTLSKLADTILFVADSSSTSRAAVASCRKELARAHTPVMGAVMNNFQTSKTVEYGTYSLRRYRYGYRLRRPQGGDPEGNGAGPIKRPSTAPEAEPLAVADVGVERSKNDPA